MKVDMGLNSFLWIHMHGGHEPAREVGADRNKGNIDVPYFFKNCFKMWTIAGISGKE